MGISTTAQPVEESPPSGIGRTIGRTMAIVTLGISLSILAQSANARDEPTPADSPAERTNGPITNRDPDRARLITEDIDRFWKAYDAIQDGSEAISTFEETYFKPATPGLESFIRLRISNAQSLSKTIEQHPDFYEKLRRSTGRIADFGPGIRKSFHELKDLYPEAVFPDVYFVVGRMNSGGTLAPIGLLIGVEMYGRLESTRIEELGNWHRQVITSVEAIPHIVAHELIHYEQKYSKNPETLLEKSIQEGSADLLAELISGRHINQHLHEYGDPRETALWREFRRRMHRKDLSGWLYDGDGSKERPADLGYYMGYKICKAYYDSKPDKKSAVRDILEIEDFREFLASSGYNGGR